MMVVVVVIVVSGGGAPSLVEGKGVHQRLPLAPVALLTLPQDLSCLLGLLGDRLLLLPQRRDLDARHGDLVVPHGRRVGGDGGLVREEDGLGSRVGSLRSGSLRGWPPKSLQ